MRIKHEWQTTRNLPASVSCSGSSLDVPGEVTIDVPEDPLQSERLTMAMEILRLAQNQAPGAFMTNWRAVTPGTNILEFLDCQIEFDTMDGKPYWRVVRAHSKHPST